MQNNQTNRPAGKPTAKSLFITGIIAAALTYFGWNFFDKGSGSPSASALNHYEKLCKSGVRTTATLNDSYKEVTYKVVKGSGGTKMNSFTYTYSVNGQTYSGSFSMNGMPASDTSEVWYEAANPGNHHYGNPCKQYEYSKAKQYPGWYLWIGIPMLGIGVLVLLGVIKTAIRSLFKK